MINYLTTLVSAMNGGFPLFMVLGVPLCFICWIWLIEKYTGQKPYYELDTVLMLSVITALGIYLFTFMFAVLFPILIPLMIFVYVVARKNNITLDKFIK